MQLREIQNKMLVDVWEWRIPTYMCAVCFFSACLTWDYQISLIPKYIFLKISQKYIFQTSQN